LSRLDDRDGPSGRAPRAERAGRTPLDLTPFRAVLFDLDGVLTTTRRLHVAAWQRALDEFLNEWDAQRGAVTPRFAPETDYVEAIDGVPRQDGVRAFLRSRAIDVPEGTPSDPPDRWSVWGIGNRKQARFDAALDERGVDAFPGSVAWVRELRAAGLATAVVSSSRNAGTVLRRAGIDDLFDACVEGAAAAELGLRGKPAPDTFLEAARRLGVDPTQAVVVEDAVAGVTAGRAGGFGLVIGVDRTGRPDQLRASGADVVVADLAELVSHADRGAGPRGHRVAASTLRLLVAGDGYPADPYRLVERSFSPEYLPQTEALFTVANGYLGIRGILEEGVPSARPASLLNGFHETWPITYGEEAFGYAHLGQTIVHVPDGAIVKIAVDDDRIDCSSTEIDHFERALDLRRGTLDRTVVWRLADGRRLRVRSRRFASLARRHLAALRYEVTALDAPIALVLTSELAEPVHPIPDGPQDPRRGRSFGDETLVFEGCASTDVGSTMTFRTATSGLRVACAMEHVVSHLGHVEHTTEAHGDTARTVLRFVAPVNEPIALVKLLGYHHGSESRDDLERRARETVMSARATGWDALLAEHRARVDEFWRRSDVVLGGAPLLQQAVRFNLFTILQATARSEGHGVPAKGLSGHGYDGHSFWDTEIYVLPFLIHTEPLVARSLLLFRYRMLDEARARAAVMDVRGALFPWRTIAGSEASANYATGTAQCHIDADIAYAIDQYVRATGDEEFLARYGAEILVETARMWADLGFESERRGGRFVINGVTGPDEYSTLVDNNLYTNLMARENLRIAARAVRWLRAHRPGDLRTLAERTGLRDDEVETWDRTANLMYVAYDEELGLHLQDDQFLEREPWDFANTSDEEHPLLLHHHPLVIYRHQVIKQADVVLATVLLDDAFTLDEKRRIFEFYDPLTTGDSSLSESIQSVAAAEIGDLRTAEDYLADALTIDLADRNGNVRDGLHVASAGGVWMALVHGLGGMRTRGEVLAFDPALPRRFDRLCFRVRRRDSTLEVDIRPDHVTYRVIEGPPLVIRHRDRCLEVTDASSTVAVAPPPPYRGVTTDLVSTPEAVTPSTPSPSADPRPHC
jgi:alpha,alpha-trehalose phosphorylase